MKRYILLSLIFCSYTMFAPKTTHFVDGKIVPVNTKSRAISLNGKRFLMAYSCSGSRKITPQYKFDQNRIEIKNKKEEDNLLFYFEHLSLNKSNVPKTPQSSPINRKKNNEEILINEFKNLNLDSKN